MSRDFKGLVSRHRTDMQRRSMLRGFRTVHPYAAVSAETAPPVGQAAGWLDDVTRYAPVGGGRHVAAQLARLCGENSEVCVPRSSLVDAVQRADGVGRPVAYVQQGIEVLRCYGWVEVETVGERRGARTTYRLCVGESAGSKMVDYADRLMAAGHGGTAA